MVGPLYIAEIAPAVAFSVFAGIAAVGFVYAFVPETKGRGLEEMEADLHETAGGEQSLAEHAESVEANSAESVDD